MWYFHPISLHSLNNQYMSFRNFLKGENLPTQGAGSLIKENNPDGYFTGAEIVTNLDRLSADPKLRYLVGNSKFLLSAMKQNVGFTKMPQHIIEEGAGYTWVSLKVGRVSRNLKIPHFGDMQRLIDDYASGVVKVSQTLEELYEEASS
jgi:hypothetical protein